MAGLDGDIKLPAVGEVPKKTVAVGAVIIAGVVGYAWWKHSQAAAVIPDTSTSTATDTQPADTTGSGPYVNPAPGSNTTTGSSPQTNVDWENAALTALEGLGFDPQTISAALSAYLDNQVLTADQANLVRQAWGLVGRPPETPSKPILTGGTTTTPTPTPVKAVGTPSGLHVAGVTSGSVSLKWTPVAGATSYRVDFRDNSNSRNPWQFTWTTDAGYTVGLLASKRNYQFAVQSNTGPTTNASTGLSAWSGSVFQNTK